MRRQAGLVPVLIMMDNMHLPPPSPPRRVPHTRSIVRLIALPRPFLASDNLDRFAVAQFVVCAFPRRSTSPMDQDQPSDGGYHDERGAGWAASLAWQLCL